MSTIKQYLSPYSAEKMIGTELRARLDTTDKSSGVIDELLHQLDCLDNPPVEKLRELKSRRYA